MRVAARAVCCRACITVCMLPRCSACIFFVILPRLKQRVAARAVCCRACIIVCMLPRELPVAARVWAWCRTSCLLPRLLSRALLAVTQVLLFWDLHALSLWRSAHASALRTLYKDGFPTLAHSRHGAKQ